MYDFDQIIERRHTDSFKWGIDDTVLPMWVADMDFAAPPEIIDAFSRRLNHPVFGYGRLPQEWGLAYQSWWKRRHSLEIETENLFFCAGIVPAISSLIRALSHPGDSIAMLTPVYNHFYDCIRNQNRKVCEIPLLFSGESYSIDKERLEKTLSSVRCPLMILCNPQNPTGTIWSADDLKTIGELCSRFGTIVLSDEIHCDLITPGQQYTPFAAASDTCRTISITCLAPTKTFNLAGLQTAALYVPNQDLQKKARSAIQKDELSMPNSFAAAAAIAAFTKGEGWLDELNIYLYENKCIVRDFLQKELPCVRMIWGDATYLLWLDCRLLNRDSRFLSHYLRREAGVYLMAGSEYGRGGEGFLRLNAACPKSLLSEGLTRFQNGIGSLIHS